MTALTFTVPGNPIPWKRARTNGKRRFNQPDVEWWKECVRCCAEVAITNREVDAWQAWDTSADYRVSVDFYRKSKVGTDLDRLLSGVLDGLECAVYVKDRQVKAIGSVGLFVDKKNPRAEITVETL